MESISAVLILHDIRSMENVGSLFRTADAAGVNRIYLSGITPAPIDRFGRPVQKVAKAALGAQRTVPWETVPDILALIRSLKEQGYRIIAIEQSPGAVDYASVVTPQYAAFILGNEVSGLPQEVLDAADVIAEIPMRGSKESLNVAVAGGIALFRMLDR